MTLGMRLSTARRLTVKAAIIEHLRWEMQNVPSTVREIAGSIGRSESAVRRTLKRMVDGGYARRIWRNRYMLAPGPKISE